MLALRCRSNLGTSSYRACAAMVRFPGLRAVRRQKWTWRNCLRRRAWGIHISLVMGDASVCDWLWFFSLHAVRGGCSSSSSSSCCCCCCCCCSCSCSCSSSSSSSCCCCCCCCCCCSLMSFVCLFVCFCLFVFVCLFLFVCLFVCFVLCCFV